MSLWCLNNSARTYDAKNVACASAYDAQKCCTHPWCSKNDPWNMSKICCTYDTQAAQVYNVKNAAQRKRPKKLQAHMMSKKSLWFPKSSTHKFCTPLWCPKMSYKICLKNAHIMSKNAEWIHDVPKWAV